MADGYDEGSPVPAHTILAVEPLPVRSNSIQRRRKKFTFWKIRGYLINHSPAASSCQLYPHGGERPTVAARVLEGEAHCSGQDAI